VDIIQVNGQRWLVAGYGAAGWGRNACAAGEVTLNRGRGPRRFEIEEADAPTAVPVLREYMTEIRVTRAYFDATPDSPDEVVAAELPRQTVFRLVSKIVGQRSTLR